MLSGGDSAIEREFTIDHTVGVDGAGNETGRTLTGFRQDGVPFDLGNVGSILGSQIGAALGGNSILERVAGSTILSVIGQNVGQFLQSAASAALTEAGVNVGRFAGQAFGDLGLFLGNIQGQVIGQISSLLMAERRLPRHRPRGGRGRRAWRSPSRAERQAGRRRAVWRSCHGRACRDYSLLRAT